MFWDVNWHELHAYLKDVRMRLPIHKSRRIDEFLPHSWVSGHAFHTDVDGRCCPYYRGRLPASSDAAAVCVFQRM